MLPRIRPPSRLHSLRQPLLTSRRQSPQCLRVTPYSQQRHNSTSTPPNEGFFSRLRSSLSATKVEWYPIPVGLGIGLLGFMQYRRVQERESRKLHEERYAAEHGGEPPGGGDGGKKKIRPTGPWQVQILSTLPLKALSRLWGRFNEIPLPTPLRPAGFKLYSYIFGVNISEAANQDLYSYRNLAEFFYREINPATRPIDPAAAVVSPADGKVLMLGEVREGGKVENVKGMTYSLDALLSGEGEVSQSANPNSPAVIFQGDASRTTEKTAKGGEVVKSQEEFARVNGISYRLGELFSGTDASSGQGKQAKMDQSIPIGVGKGGDVEELHRVIGTKAGAWFRQATEGTKRLYFAVVYLAPGDYHRFHSPTEWVVETRRHFAGELFSVSPYLQALLPSLFILNERVVLLGRWRHGFFSMTPVGATNVGSIVLNFDRELRTNSLTKETGADRVEKGGYAEATYKAASTILEGHPLRRGEEMGGFRLGSTVVLVFEAPEGKNGRGFKWTAEKGKHIKMGEPLGVVE